MEFANFDSLKISNTKQKMKYSKIKLAQEALKHKGFLQKIPSVYRMFKLWYKGEYKMKVTDVLILVLAFVYVISPIDFIPDFVPVVGALDDLAILAMAIPMLMKEVDKFLLWESQLRKGNREIQDAEIVK